MKTTQMLKPKAYLIKAYDLIIYNILVSHWNCLEISNTTTYWLQADITCRSTCSGVIEVWIKLIQF